MRLGGVGETVVGGVEIPLLQLSTKMNSCGYSLVSVTIPSSFLNLTPHPSPQFTTDIKFTVKDTFTIMGIKNANPKLLKRQLENCIGQPQKYGEDNRSCGLKWLAQNSVIK